MPERRITLAKEELMRIIEMCETIEKSGIDPFSVNIKELLRKLRNILETAGNLDVVVLDAETMYRISVIIALQHRWLIERAGNLFIDPQVIATRIVAADNKTLALALARSWRPIVSGEQLTKKMMLDGMEYFLMLPPRGLRRGREATAVSETPETGDVKNSMFMETEILEQKMQELHRELLEERNGEEIDYWYFLSKQGDEKAVERAYVLSFLISEGYADLRRNPITGEIKIIPYHAKKKRESPASIAIAIRKRGEVRGSG